ncbi:MAG: response regulator [Myxococcota bacterium]
MNMKLCGDGPVVIVDDDPTDIAILRRCFDRSALAATHRLLTFLSGEEALEHMKRAEAAQAPMPSIILLDINMPRMDGFETLRAIRSREAFRTIPAIVFVSNSDNPRDVTRASSLGAGFCEKFSKWREGVAFFNALV